MLRYDNPSLDQFEQTLRGWGVYPLVQILFYSIEMFIASVYITKRKPNFWFCLIAYASYVAANVALTQIFDSVQWWEDSALTAILLLFLCFFYKKGNKKYLLECFLRYLIFLILSLLLDLLIYFLRNGIIDSYGFTRMSLSIDLALNIENYLALGLALGFLTLLIPWEEGEKQCKTIRTAGLSSPISTSKSPTSPKKPIAAKTKSELPKGTIRKIRWLYLRTFLVQSVALIAALRPFPVPAYLSCSPYANATSVTCGY